MHGEMIWNTTLLILEHLADATRGHDLYCSPPVCTNLRDHRDPDK